MVIPGDTARHPYPVIEYATLNTNPEETYIKPIT